MKKQRNDRLLKLGEACGNFRRRYLGASQAEVARDLGCTPSNISLFECGKNDSARILLWYVDRGFWPLVDVEVWSNGIF